MKQKIILIGGPTGVGKTKLGILLANKYNGEVISCDSIAIYKGLDIGSAKPTKDEQKQAVHHQIDIIEPNQDYSVAEYVKQTRNLINQIVSRGKLPIIVGGTGLFMKALLFPYEFSNSQKDQTIRDKYTNLAIEHGNEYVYDILKQLDPESAEKLHPNDSKRIIRAIEIFETTGTKKINNCNQESLYDYHLIFLNGNRTEIYDRINQRVDFMIKGGLQAEIEGLMNDYNLTRDNQSMQAIGYKEWFDFFENKIDYSELIDKIKTNSRHYAKRQITWFKAMPKVKEYNYKNLDKILLDVDLFLTKSGDNMINNKLVIAIDGPAGAGKTTIAKAVAEKLDIMYLNTGAMYRALGYKCKMLNLDAKEDSVADKIAKQTILDVKYENGEQQVYVDGENVTPHLYNEVIGAYASDIAKHQIIRDLCVEIQRYVATKQSIIVDGRDIGTVVLKNADYKFYLDAKIEERAKRRFLDLSKTNNQITYQEVLEDMKIRDYNDINREVSPLKVASDAIIIDSTNMNAEQVVNFILNYINKE